MCLEQKKFRGECGEGATKGNEGCYWILDRCYRLIDFSHLTSEKVAGKFILEQFESCWRYC